jgi:hypothetical protein
MNRTFTKRLTIAVAILAQASAAFAGNTLSGGPVFHQNPTNGACFYTNFGTSPITPIKQIVLRQNGAEQ